MSPRPVRVVGHDRLALMDWQRAIKRVNHDVEKQKHGAVDAFFHISKRGSTFATEIVAGFLTFVSMAYIVSVNAVIFSASVPPALDRSDVSVATAAVSGFSSILIGLVGNLPLGCAPAMGINVYVASTLMSNENLSSEGVLAIIFIQGCLSLCLGFGGLAKKLINAIPVVIRQSTAAGVGLLVAFVGYKNIGLIVDDTIDLVGPGDLSNNKLIISLSGLALLGILSTLRVKGATLVALVFTTIILWGTGEDDTPSEIVAKPTISSATLASLDFNVFGDAPGDAIIGLLALLFMVLMNNVAMLGAMCGIAGLLEDGDLTARQSSAGMVATSLGTILGGILGTSPVIVFAESAVGLQYGGKTGLTAITTGICFFITLPFIPVISTIPSGAVAPILISLGSLMVSEVKNIEWMITEKGIPAFLVLSVIPLSINVAFGMAFGLVAYILLHGVLYVATHIVKRYNLSWGSNIEKRENDFTSWADTVDVLKKALANPNLAERLADANRSDSDFYSSDYQSDGKSVSSRTSSSI